MTRAVKALALISKVTGAQSVNGAVDAFQEAIEPFGVTLYRTSALGNLERAPVADATVDNWTKDWNDFYFGKRAFQFDPTVRAALTRTEGFFWRDLPPPQTRSARELMSAAAGAGMVDGFVAMRSSPGELKTTVYMSGERLDWDDAERGVVSFVANTLMCRLLYLRDVALTPAIQSLSDREREVLHHAALGKGDKVIAIALGIKFATVRFHWTSIHRKLGTTDRAHAVAVGLWTGQIAP